MKHALLKAKSTYECVLNYAINNVTKTVEKEGRKKKLFLRFYDWIE